jgi:nucleotide-binding universal stress UspA family protein
MQPFETILFAADFSENSKEAFRAASSLAIENTTRLVVLHVAAPEWSPEEPVCEVEQTTASRTKECGEARHAVLKQSLRNAYSPTRPIDVEYLTREGDAAAEILRVAEEKGSDLIVMGTHGQTGLRHLLTGSVSMAVLHAANVPVLALRTGAKRREREQIRIILHPTDFSAGSDAALRVARLLAREHGARLILMHVAPPPLTGDDGTSAVRDIRHSRDALDIQRELIDGPDLKYPVETWFSRGPAPDEIVRVAKEVGCDLIVMGTHGRTGLGRLLLGNTAESVLPEADCPVIILRSRQAIAAAKSSASAAKSSVWVF